MELDRLHGMMQILMCIFLKVLHAQLIFQLQSFPYDPKFIDLYGVNTNLPQ